MASGQNDDINEHNYQYFTINCLLDDGYMIKYLPNRNLHNQANLTVYQDGKHIHTSMYLEHKKATFKEFIKQIIQHKRDKPGCEVKCLEYYSEDNQTYLPLKYSLSDLMIISSA